MVNSIKIKYIYDKTIFESNADAIVNTVNCVGVMGKGLALEFKERYPDMYRDYMEKCNKGEIKLGIISEFYTNNKLILNFPTKNNFKENSKIEYIEQGLDFFKKNYRNWKIKSVAFPQLGCRNGKLDWNQVKSIMENYLEPLDLEIEIYIFSKDVIIHEINEIMNKLSLNDLEQLKSHVYNIIKPDEKSKYKNIMNYESKKSINLSEPIIIIFSNKKSTSEIFYEQYLNLYPQLDFTKLLENNLTITDNDLKNRIEKIIKNKKRVVILISSLDIPLWTYLSNYFIKLIYIDEKKTVDNENNYSSDTTINDLEKLKMKYYKLKYFQCSIDKNSKFDKDFIIYQY
jgi:O-acetyl-ADP-ribose deacetylase (regulator of RNase III)